jgi:hypothetical protein
MSSYDLPNRWLQRTWMQEHLVKMISAYVAISSAFAGTVFPGFIPWSAIVPSSIGYILMIFFLLRGPAKWNNSNTRDYLAVLPGSRTFPISPTP